jgi:hypothetical protein
MTPDLTPAGRMIDRCNRWYKAGQWAGVAWSAAMMVAGAASAAAEAGPAASIIEGETASAASGLGDGTSAPAAGTAASSMPGTSGSTGTSRLAATKQSILEWLGEDATVVQNSDSDLMLQSADKTRTIRFDLVNSHGEAPHINVETWRPRNLYPGDGRMIRLSNKHIYPQP